MLLSGGVANATIDVDFPQTGHHVVLQQDFSGLNVFNHLSVETRLNGAVPAIAFGEKVEMDGYTNTIVRIGRGQNSEAMISVSSTVQVGA